MRKLIDICPDFNEWPNRWMGTKADLEYGHQLLAVFQPVAVFLAESTLKDSTVKRDLTNLWLLGGQIIRDVSLYREYSLPALEKVKESVDELGNPDCRHLDSEAEIKSFDSTCRKFHKYLEGKF